MKEIRLFVSSTFADTHAEREHLVRKTLPIVSHHISQRGLHLIDIDLRWGVPADTTKQQVIEICLGEIERCRRTNGDPYFLCLVGSRYGWVPSQEDVSHPCHDDGQLIRDRWDWCDGLSITHHEALVAALREGNPNSMFFLRDPAVLTSGEFMQNVRPSREVGTQGINAHYEAWVEEQGSTKAMALELFKNEIQSAHSQHRVGAMHTYSLEFDSINRETMCVQFKREGLEKFGQTVMNDLMRFVDSYETPVEAMSAHMGTTEQHEELIRRSMQAFRESQTSFMHSVSHDNIGREEESQKILSYLQRKDSEVVDRLSSTTQESVPPMLVCGRSGSGKSALIASAIHNHIESGRGKMISAYVFIGATPRSVEMTFVLTYVSWWLSEQCGFQFDLMKKRSWDDAVQSFLTILDRSSKWCLDKDQCLVVILDSLERLEDGDGAKSLSWLPRVVPKGLRVILTGKVGDVTTTCAHNRFPELQTIQLGGISTNDRRTFVTNTLSRWRKALSDEDLDHLIGKEGSTSTLYLKVACSELKLFGQFEKLTAKIDSIAPTVSGLLAQVLARIEQDHDSVKSKRPIVKSVLSFLRCSQAGMEEDQLMELSRKICFPTEDHFPSAVWAHLHSAITIYLTPRGADEMKLRLYDSYFSEAIEERYLNTPSWTEYVRGLICSHNVQELKAATTDATSEYVDSLAQSQQCRDAVSEICFQTTRMESPPSEALVFIASCNHLLPVMWHRAIRPLTIESWDRLGSASGVSGGTTTQTPTAMPGTALANYLQRRVAGGVASLKAMSQPYLRTAGDILYHFGKYQAATNVYLQLVKHYSPALSNKKLGLVEDQVKDTLRVADLERKVGNLKGSFARIQALIEEVQAATSILKRQKLTADRASRLSKLQTLLWHCMMRQADISVKLGEYSTAESVYTQLLDVAQKKESAREEEAMGLREDIAEMFETAGEFKRKMGDNEGALKLFSMAMEIEETLGSSRVWKVENHIGEVELKEGMFNEANETLERALERCNKSFGANHLNTSKVLANLGELQLKQSQYKAAEATLSQALEIKKQALGEHTDIAKVYNLLAELRQKTGRFDEAENLYQTAVDIRSRLLGEDHPDMAKLYNNIGELYVARGKMSEAADQFDHALAIREEHLGSDHTEVAKVLNNIAELYQKTGEYQQAIEINKRVLEIRELRQGPDHPDVAKIVSNIAFMHHKLGELNQAELRYNRAQSIYEMAGFQDHPKMATVEFRRGKLEVKMGRYDEARNRFLRALEIRSEKLGNQHPDVAEVEGTLGELDVKMARYDEAQRRYKRALAVRTKAFGTTHPDVAEIQNNLGELNQILNRLDAADDYYTKAFASRVQTYGEIHNEVAKVSNNLATLHEKRGDNEKAKELYEKAISIRETLFGQDHADLAKPLCNYATLLSKDPNTKQCFKTNLKIKKLYNRALSNRTRVLGETHPQLVDILLPMAAFSEGQGQYYSAEQVLGRALNILEQSLGFSHPLAGTVVNRLLDMYKAQQKTYPAEKLLTRFHNGLEKELGPTNKMSIDSLCKLVCHYKQQSKHLKAAKCLENKLKMLEEIRDLEGQGVELDHVVDFVVKELRGTLDPSSFRAKDLRKRYPS